MTLFCVIFFFNEFNDNYYWPTRRTSLIAGMLAQLLDECFCLDGLVWHNFCILILVVLDLNWKNKVGEFGLGKGVFCTFGKFERRYRSHRRFFVTYILGRVLRRFFQLPFRIFMQLKWLFVCTFVVMGLDNK